MKKRAFSLLGLRVKIYLLAKISIEIRNVIGFQLLLGRFLLLKFLFDFKMGNFREIQALAGFRLPESQLILEIGFA